MDPYAAMGILVGVLAVVLIGAFLLLWSRDKNRSDSVADDAERLDTDSHRRPASGR